MRIRFSNLAADFKALSIVDKIIDIASFLLMVIAVIVHAATRDDSMMLLQISLNVAATLTLFIGRILFSPHSLFGKLSLKAQKYINFIVLTGSFGGQFLLLGGFYENYDTVTHLFTGSLCCLIALHAYEAMSGEHAHSKPSLCASYTFFVSLGISCIWEIFEFCADFINGSGCQYYTCDGTSTKFYYFINFPIGAKPLEQGPLYDTFSDLICGFIAAVITALAIGRFLSGRAKKIEKAEL